MEDKTTFSKEINLENKRVMLQLLQEPIGRMSSTSAIFKGFSAAILAGLASASVADISIWALVLGLVPIVVFFLLDVCYLRVERKLRYRYNEIADLESEVTSFKIDLNLGKNEIKTAKACFWNCLKSFSIWPFYLVMIGCAVALIVLKATGNI